MLNKLIQKVRGIFGAPAPVAPVAPVDLVQQVAPKVDLPKAEEKKPDPVGLTVATEWPFPVYHPEEGEAKTVKSAKPEKAPAPENKKPGRKKKEQPVKTSAAAIKSVKE